VEDQEFRFSEKMVSMTVVLARVVVVHSATSATDFAQS
jgi:hypothetical protein